MVTRGLSCALQEVSNTEAAIEAGASPAWSTGMPTARSTGGAGGLARVSGGDATERRWRV